MVPDMLAAVAVQGTRGGDTPSVFSGGWAFVIERDRTKEAYKKKLKMDAPSAPN
jgi:hypothetical protein